MSYLANNIVVYDWDALDALLERQHIDVDARAVCECIADWYEAVENCDPLCSRCHQPFDWGPEAFAVTTVAPGCGFVEPLCERCAGVEQ
jgi:hypothetical protein